MDWLATQAMNTTLKQAANKHSQNARLFAKSSSSLLAKPSAAAWSYTPLGLVAVACGGLLAITAGIVLLRRRGVEVEDSIEQLIALTQDEDIRGLARSAE